jgi:hypothetical protein
MISEGANQDRHEVLQKVAKCQRRLAGSFGPESGSYMKFLTFLPVILFGAIFATEGQEAPPQPAQIPAMEYTGKPLNLPFHCSDDDIRWAGLTCSENEPCPIYLELTTVQASGDRIFVAGDLHSVAVTLYSALLATLDGGRTWSEPTPRIRGAVLDRIEFLDTETGWVSGHSDSPLPRDPFLLTTTDGGKTWRQRPIFSEAAEDRLGMIQEFLFSARDSGSLIIDRGQGSADDRWELYESPDGGASWSIKRSSSKSLRLNQAFTPHPDWRLRADGPSKSFHIEHRRDDRWTTAAAFAVSVGVCRPQP